MALDDKTQTDEANAGTEAVQRLKAAVAKRAEAREDQANDHAQEEPIIKASFTEEMTVPAENISASYGNDQEFIGGAIAPAEEVIQDDPKDPMPDNDFIVMGPEDSQDKPQLQSQIEEDEYNRHEINERRKRAIAGLKQTTAGFVAPEIKSNLDLSNIEFPERDALDSSKLEEEKSVRELFGRIFTMMFDYLAPINKGLQLTLSSMHRLIYNDPRENNDTMPLIVRPFDLDSDPDFLENHFDEISDFYKYKVDNGVMSAEEADNDFFRYRSPLDSQPTENNSETMRNVTRNTRNAKPIIEDIADADESPPEFHMPEEVKQDLPMPSSDADSQPTPDLNQVEAKPSEAEENPTQDIPVENETAFTTRRNKTGESTQQESVEAVKREQPRNAINGKPRIKFKKPQSGLNNDQAPVFKTRRTVPAEDAGKIDFGQRESRINFQPTAEDVIEDKPESPKAAPVEAYLGEVIPGNELQNASTEKKDERIAFRERAAAARAENRARCKKGPREILGPHKP